MDINTAKYIEEKIDEICAINNFNDKRKSLDIELNNIFDSCAKTINECICISIIYFKGFDAINMGEINIDNQIVVQWVKNADRSRSSRLIAGFIATQIVSTLEHFINDLTEYAKNNINKFRKDYEDIEEEIKTSNKNVSLKTYLKPSSRKNNRWLAKIKQLYKIEVAPEIELILYDLIDQRQQASHTDISVQTSIAGEHIKLWGVGTRLFIQELILSVRKKMKISSEHYATD